MNRTRSFLLPSLFVLGTAFSLHAGPNDTAWIQLFDKTDTVLRNDWDIKITGSALNVDTRNTFRWAVSNGDTVIEVNYSNYTTFGGSYGHMGYKHRSFSHYLLRSEYQVWGTQTAGNPGSWALENNGFMLHSQSMASMTLNQDFPVSLEAQLLGPANNSAGGATSASTMNLCTPGTGFHSAPTGGDVVNTHCIPAKPLARAPANTGWQKVSALILGDSLHQYYAGPNGTDSVMRYYRPVYLSGNVANPPAGIPADGTPLTEGYIVIQSESHPYRFRKIEVVDLVGCMTPGDVNYKTYLVKHDSTACGGTSGIRGASARDARRAAPVSFADGAIRVDGNEYVTLEVFDTKGVRVGRYAARAPFVWSPGAAARGMTLIRVQTARGTYVEKIPLF